MDLENFDDIDLETRSDTSEDVTAAQVLEMLEEAWVNEKFAPEILPHKIEVVDCLLIQIKHMETNIQNLPKNDFQRGLHQLEVDRIKYVLSSYLRTRLEKIEKFSQVILQEENERISGSVEPYLTPSELTFAKQFQRLQDNHFEEIFKFIPVYVTDESKDDPVRPNLQSFVFLKSKGHIEGIVVDSEGDDLVDLRPGSQMILEYSSIANFVKNGDINLM